jgi:cell division inhibitor SepF
MSSLWQKTLMYLGLVDEEQLEEDAEARAAAPARSTRPPSTSRTSRATGNSGDVVAGRRVEPPPLGTRPVAVPPDSGGGYESGSGSVRPVRTVEVHTEVVTVTDFGDAKVLADRIRERTPVMLDLRSTEPDMVRRIVDFASGLTYALDGTMSKTADGVVLVMPPRLSLGRDELRRLSSMGLYDMPDASGS